MSNIDKQLTLLLQQAKSNLDQGDKLAASALFEVVLTTNPDNALALLGLGSIAFQSGNYEAASHRYLQATNVRVSKKRLPDIYFYLATSLHLLGHYSQAISYFIKALLLDPRHIAAHVNLGMSYCEKEQYTEAIHVFKKLISLAPMHADAHANLGHALFKLGKLKASIAAVEKALSIDPHHALANKNIGPLYQSLGRFSEAEASLKKAILQNPADAESYRHLVQTRKMTRDDASLVAQISALTKSTTLAQGLKSDSFFALGKCLDDLAQYDEAFESIKQANRLERGDSTYDRQQHENNIDTQIAHFTKEFFSSRLTKLDTLASESAPILIVGMPRSGTTLIAQVLSSHPQIKSAGEVLFWDLQVQALTPNAVLKLSPDSLSALANQYIAGLRAICPKSSRILDKMPSNFMHLGLIHLCLPMARIVHCQRNPLDTCLSIFFSKFSGSHPYSYDLSDLTFYYQQYEKLMAHWRAVLGTCMIEVKYEEMVGNLEAETKKLLQFCNVEWDEKCLDFSRNEQAVFTASNWQVRQPLYQSSVGRWEHYRAHLGALLQLSNQKSEVKC